MNRGQHRAMLMQLLQRPLTGSRGQALEECECPERQHEAQNLDTTKAAMLAHNPQDPEWCRYVRLRATRLQEHDELKSVCKETGKGKGKSKRKGKGKRKGKEKSKRKGKDKRKKQGQVEGKDIRHIEHEMLLSQRKGSSQVPEMASREENNGSRVEQVDHD